jgi:polar amino acid transport system substrate-binding protein
MRDVKKQTVKPAVIITRTEAAGPISSGFISNFKSRAKIQVTGHSVATLCLLPYTLISFNTSPMQFPRILVIAAILLQTFASIACAQAPSTLSGRGATLRVATRVVPPFVIQNEDKKLSGFSIDLWNAIVKELGVKSQFLVVDNVKQILAVTQSRRADIGIAAISITSDREKSVDFSQPMFDAGLQILVPDKSNGNSTPSILSVLLSPAMLQALGIVALLVLIPSHIVWLVERNHEGGIIENKHYFPGIFKAVWWAAGTLGAQADEMPRSIPGRLVALLWMFTGLAFIAYFTAIITASMTVSQLQGEINGPDDLPGKKVATIAGSTSEKYLNSRGLKAREYSQFSDAAKALEAGTVQAVVFDSPVLMYYAANGGKDKVHAVGPIFRKESYGISFPTGSPWRRRVNYALLSLKESGNYDEIYSKWFHDSASD